MAGGLLGTTQLTQVPPTPSSLHVAFLSARTRQLILSQVWLVWLCQEVLPFLGLYFHFFILYCILLTVST